MLYNPEVRITYSNNRVNFVSNITTAKCQIDYLSTTQTNSQFTPTEDNDPATKKYVDNFEYNGESSGIGTYTISSGNEDFIITEEDNKLRIKPKFTDTGSSGTLGITFSKGFEIDKLRLVPIEINCTSAISGLSVSLNSSNIDGLNDWFGAVTTATVSPLTNKIKISDNSLINFKIDFFDGSGEKCEFYIERVSDTTYLSTTNTSEYTPTNDYNPATKKYVDDNSPDVFYWDGLSSTSNPKNKELWQKVVDKANLKTVIVYASHESSTSKQKKAVFILNPQDFLTPTGTKQISGLLNYSANSVNSGTGTYHTIYYPSVSITFTNRRVSSITSISYSSQSSYKYLPTDNTQVLSYVPTYDYHPATKKYVDDIKYKGSPKLNISCNVTNNNGFDPYQTETECVFTASYGTINPSANIDISGCVEGAKLKLTRIIIGENVTPYEYILFENNDVSFNENGEWTYIEQSGDTELHFYLEAGFISGDSNSKIIYMFTRTDSSGSEVTYLSTTNTSEYNPTDDYHPATKKYIDDKLKIKENWNNITLLNGWETYDFDTYDIAQFRIENNRVFLRGVVKNGKSNTILGVLPENYRPLKNKIFISAMKLVGTETVDVSSVPEYLRVNISPNGEITVVPHVGSEYRVSYLSLDGINFELD